MSALWLAIIPVLVTIILVYFTLYRILKALYRSHRVWFVALLIFLSPFAFVLSQVRGLIELMWVLLLTPFYGVFVLSIISTVWMVRFYCLALSILIIANLLFQRKRAAGAQKGGDRLEAFWGRFLGERTRFVGQAETRLTRVLRGGRVFTEGFSRYWSLVLCIALLATLGATLVSGSSLQKPTYHEVQEFIQSDTTDKHPYVEGSYVCANFAADFRTNAAKAGYESGLVFVLFPDATRHELNSFNTTDAGLVFVEPQLDQIVNVTVGQPYGSTTPSSSNKTVVGYYIDW